MSVDHFCFSSVDRCVVSWHNPSLSDWLRRAVAESTQLVLKSFYDPADRKPDGGTAYLKNVECLPHSVDRLEGCAAVSPPPAKILDNRRSGNAFESINLLVEQLFCVVVSRKSLAHFRYQVLLNVLGTGFRVRARSVYACSAGISRLYCCTMVATKTPQHQTLVVWRSELGEIWSHSTHFRRAARPRASRVLIN
jgi:hypothetical protein